jgi:hypothetical protein
MGSRWALALATAAIFALTAAAPAQGAITVANQNDSGPGSLRQAIAEAPPGETINVPAGTYTLTSEELSITKSLTISGHAAGDTIVRAGGQFRVFGISGPGNGVTIEGLTIRDGNAFKSGGGVLNQGATLTLRRVVVSNNVAGADGLAPKQFGGIANGGGIYNQAGTLFLVDSAITGNRASAVGASEAFGGIVSGGGVSSLGPFAIQGSTIAGNTVDARGGQGPSNGSQFGGIGNGGGLFANIDLPSSVTGTTISGNLVDVSEGPGGFAGIGTGGGASFLIGSAAQVALTGTTIAANEARGLGGGIVEGGGISFNASSENPLVATSTTLAGNAVDLEYGAGGNLSWSSTSPPRFRNSIISGGIAPPGNENCGQSVESLGFNLESLDQCGLKAGGDQVNRDPLLGPLRDNGGLTATMAPAANSPVVDQGAASGLTADQRGVVRPINLPTIPDSAASGADGSDIGAVEFQPSNALALGKLKKNKKKGTATLRVLLPLPSAGTLTLEGKGLKTQTAAIAGQADVKLRVLPKGKARKALRKRGRRKVQIKVTYTPLGNSAATATRKAKLVRKHRKRRRPER